MPSRRGGFQLWGTEFEGVTLPSWVVSTDFRELKPPGASLQPRGRVGEFPPKPDP